jgi:hypothetical protein
MASIINSDDGVISGTAGLKSTGANDGALNIQTNGTNAITVSSAQTVAINGNNISADNSLGFRNRFINGAMVIDQRNAGASVTPTVNGTYTLDRWRTSLSQASKYSVQQNAGSVTPPVGFANYLGITSTSAYSIVSSDYFILQQAIEGFNTNDLGWGTASAKSITISFWVRSSLTGTFGGVLYNSAGNRSYPFTYTISAANTWEQKSVTIAGDTSGTWLTNNGVGIWVNFGLGVGSTYSGTAGSWSGNLYFSATGATSVVGTNGATFYITGVQLEVGSVATPFERRDYGRELAMCQRYYEKYSLGSNTTICMMQCYSTSAALGGPIKYTVTKRATPTITLPVAGSGTNQAALIGSNASFPATIGTHTLTGTTVDMARVDATGYTSAFTAGNASTYISTNSGTAVIEISAEL